MRTTAGQLDVVINRSEEKLRLQIIGDVIVALQFRSIRYMPHNGFEVIR
jgi:hypothetical protein